MSSTIIYLSFYNRIVTKRTDQVINEAPNQFSPIKAMVVESNDYLHHNVIVIQRSLNCYLTLVNTLGFNVYRLDSVCPTSISDDWKFLVHREGDTSHLHPRQPVIAQKLHTLLNKYVNLILVPLEYSVIRNIYKMFMKITDIADKTDIIYIFLKLFLCIRECSYCNVHGMPLMKR